MKIELNFQADKPTLNGHIYPKEVLKKALDESISTGLQVVRSCDDFDNKLYPKEPIGDVKSYDIDSEGKIILNVESKFSEELKNYKLTTFGYAEKNTGQKIIDFKLLGLFIDPTSYRKE